MERIYNADERKNACWYRHYAEISPCTHPGATYTVSGTDSKGTHTRHCSHCTTAVEPENHTFENGTCTICGAVLDTSISLADNSDNSETLTEYNGFMVARVTLTGRKLYTDGTWNTLCLPFSLTAEQVHEQMSPDGLMTLSESKFADGTLTLTFENASEIVAGKPYIVKWNATTAEYVVDPYFDYVTISNSYNPVETDVVVFVGTYSPVSISEEGDNSMLYLGAGNTLYYPSGTMTIGSFRAYFQLLGGLTAGEPENDETDMQGIRAFKLNFGEEETGIEEVHGYGLEDHGYGPGWYTLDGRKLEDKPTQKGVYISGGRKMIIK